MEFNLFNLFLDTNNSNIEKKEMSGDVRRNRPMHTSNRSL